MWICPKCQREFKRINQSHYCGDAPKTVEDYILSQPVAIQPFLSSLREIILESLDDIDEKISWSMPTFKRGEQSISFSANKNELSLYVGQDVIVAFKEQLIDYKTKKSAIYFPYNTLLPKQLIQTMITYSLKEK